MRHVLNDFALIAEGWMFYALAVLSLIVAIAALPFIAIAGPRAAIWIHGYADWLMERNDALKAEWDANRSGDEEGE